MRARTTFFRTAAAAVLAVLAATGPSSALAGPAASAGSGTTTGGAGPAVSAVPDAAAALGDRLFEGVNGDRTAAGLVAFVRDAKLDRIAQDRAARLAASPQFGHPFAGDPLLDVVAASGIGPLLVGEDLGWSSYPSEAGLAWIRDAWRRSPGHRAILLSGTASYAGVGIASSGDRTYAVLVVAETLDRTPPIVTITATERRGDAAVVRWAARDPLLQAHTAGVRDTAVQYRVGTGPWRTLEPSNAWGVATMTGLEAGRTYVVRLRARDRAGNVSAWVETPPIRIP